MDALQRPSIMRHDTSQPFGPAPPVEQKVINLALQGGGAHGAFTWGVLDMLLADPRIAFDGKRQQCGRHGAVMTYGWAVGGRSGAKRTLANFGIE
jgi:NTE family protein